MPPVRDHEPEYPEGYRPIPGRKSRTWMFTYNNWMPEDLEKIMEENCTWLICAEEVAPTTGTPHLQGYVMYTSQIHWKALASRHPGCWFKPADGSPMHNYLYVTKTRPERVDKDTGETLPADPVPNPEELIHEKGTRPNFAKRAQANKANSQKGGDATKELWDQAYEAAKIGDWDAIPKNILISNMPNLQRIYQMERAKVKPMENVVLRLWQQELANILEGPVHPRHIYWYWEETGNVGKSFMASYLQRNMGATVLSNGKTSDIAHVLDQPNIVCFDFARDSIEHINYGVMEDIKNGRIFSPKYQSICKAFDIPHLVVFANYPCPHGKFSADRLQEVNLSTWRPSIPPVVPELRRERSTDAFNLRSAARGFVFPGMDGTNPDNSPYNEAELNTHFDFDFLN